MAFVRYTALRFFVFAVVAALLWIIGWPGDTFLLLIVALLISSILSIFVLSKSRDALSATLVNRQEKIKRRIAERQAAEDAWNDRVRGETDDGQR
jgi:Mn2+/Fe2+ NRAMP family transporter